MTDLPPDYYPLNLDHCLYCGEWKHKMYEHCGKTECREQQLEARRDPLEVKP